MWVNLPSWLQISVSLKLVHSPSPMPNKLPPFVRCTITQSSSRGVILCPPCGSSASPALPTIRTHSAASVLFVSTNIRSSYIIPLLYCYCHIFKMSCRAGARVSARQLTCCTNLWQTYGQIASADRSKWRYTSPLPVKIDNCQFQQPWHYTSKLHRATFCVYDFRFNRN